MRYGVYEVICSLDYRGHSPGTRFVARLDSDAETRAIVRGNIRLVEEISSLMPAEHELPAGWADSNHTTGAPSGASTVERGK